MIAQPPKSTPNPVFDFNMNMLRAFHSAVQSWGPEYKFYADKIQKWTPKSMETGYMVVAEPMTCGFQVLNHGSVNSSKFLTKFNEENNPIDVLKGGFCGATGINSYLVNGTLLFISLLIGVIVYGWSMRFGSRDAASSLRNAVVGTLLVAGSTTLAKAFISNGCA